jgi:hypothetical protein
MDFAEYIVAIAQYCMFSHTEILQFCFDTYDLDGNGTIDTDEFAGIYKGIQQPENGISGNMVSALQMFDINGDGLMDFTEFTELCRRYPMIFHPAFQLQDMLQKATLGRRKWETLINRRLLKKDIWNYYEKHDKTWPLPTEVVPKVKWKMKVWWRGVQKKRSSRRASQMTPLEHPYEALCSYEIFRAAELKKERAQNRLTFKQRKADKVRDELEVQAKEQKKHEMDNVADDWEAPDPNKKKIKENLAPGAEERLLKERIVGDAVTPLDPPLSSEGDGVGALLGQLGGVLSASLPASLFSSAPKDKDDQPPATIPGEPDGTSPGKPGGTKEDRSPATSSGKPRRIKRERKDRKVTEI